MSQPIKDVRVQAFQVTFITIEWADGRKRTAATTNPADGVTLGILVKGGVSPEEIDRQFKDKLSFEPLRLADVMQRMTATSAN